MRWISLIILSLWSFSVLHAEGIRISEGRNLFMDPCYRCHPLAEQETGKIAPRIKSMDVFAFAAAIWNQSPNMLKAFETKGWKLPSIDSRQMLQIFLFTQVMADRVRVGDPELGKRFVEANHCLSCHSIGGQGVEVGPSWDRFADTLHPTILMSAIWLHRRQMIYAFKQRNVALPEFQKGDLANLQAFIRQNGRSPGIAPILVDLEKVTIEPSMFGKFHCNSCHDVGEFAGHPERSLQTITESLLTHAFMPAFAKPPLELLVMTPEDSVSIAGLIYYFGHLRLATDPAKGKRIFSQHGCNECHDEPDGSTKDGIVIEPVRDTWDLISRIFNKVPNMIQEAKLESRAFPRLTPEEMAQLYAYLCASSPTCKSQSQVPVLSAE